MAAPKLFPGSNLKMKVNENMLRFAVLPEVLRRVRKPDEKIVHFSQLTRSRSVAERRSRLRTISHEPGIETPAHSRDGRIVCDVPILGNLGEIIERGIIIFGVMRPEISVQAAERSP